jgi:hypothetical protein
LRQSIQKTFQGYHAFSSKENQRQKYIPTAAGTTTFDGAKNV